MSPDVVAVTLRTADGLELEGEAADPTEPLIAAVLLAHPHPAQGGSMRSLVTSELFSDLPGRGCAVVRFNFRGVGHSQGVHAGGSDERRDVVAGLDVLAARAEGVPVVVAGWSFGADVSLAVVDHRISGWFAVAPPLRVLDVEAFVARDDGRPKHLAVPEHDQFNPPDLCRPRVATWTNTTVEVVPGADHFLVGRTRWLADHLVAFAGALPPPATVTGPPA